MGHTADGGTRSFDFGAIFGAVLCSSRLEYNDKMNVLDHAKTETDQHHGLDSPAPPPFPRRRSTFQKKQSRRTATGAAHCAITLPARPTATPTSLPWVGWNGCAALPSLCTILYRVRGGDRSRRKWPDWNTVLARTANHGWALWILPTSSTASRWSSGPHHVE